MATELETLAAWATAVRAEDVPARVFELARLQIRSVLASVYAGAGTEVGRACRDAALALGTSGAATVLPTGERASAFAAVLATAPAAMAHDFDDYLFLGHTGHSAVLAGLAVAEETGATLRDLLVAQVVANEIAGRLGAYVVVGPQNGQTWAHIHAAAAVVCAARLRGMSAAQAADALAIAFYQPHYTLFAGFMGSEAKALTAAQPMAAGLYAASLAARGVGGARDLLEHPRGFAAAFSFVPLPRLLRGLGQQWVSDSLSFKIYPGCAYIDGPVDAALAARGQRAIEPSEVQSVDIEATALTSAMEAICEESAPATSLEPIAVTFSARRSVAIALLAGELTPRQLEPAWLADNAGAILAIAERTRVEMTVGRTSAMLRGIGAAVPMMDLVRDLGLRKIWRTRHRLRSSYVAAAQRGGNRRRPVQLTAAGWLELLAPIARAAISGRGQRDFRQLEFRFGARVRITLRGGEVLEAEVETPRGAAGRSTAETRALVIAKLAAEAAAAGAPERAGAIGSLLDGPDDVPATALARAVVG
ncbi:MAG TPA: MmgE/PrpD family protein [Kofleriaceae bacterium]|nr:MmgE/PrpD family protein [Kofleriaceae bacterium]